MTNKQQLLSLVALLGGSVAVTGSPAVTTAGPVRPNLAETTESNPAPLLQIEVMPSPAEILMVVRPN